MDETTYTDERQQYYNENRKALIERQKAYYQRNREARIAYYKQYRIDNEVLIKSRYNVIYAINSTTFKLNKNIRRNGKVLKAGIYKRVKE